MSTENLNTKPRYELLDGMRGVAALLVVWYHIFEGFCTSPTDQNFNHGYLAVDFFFILSGFVVGYAYDDRWGKMSIKEFFKRRLIRLHPMIVVGVLLGAIAWVAQGCELWDHTKVGLGWLGVAVAMSFLLIPAIPGTPTDVRGNGEMFPLNGPSWSLFFEYIGNILYALVLRRLSTRVLGWVVALSAVGVAVYAIGNGSGYYNMGVGWSLAGTGFLGGFLRLSFAFSAGLLMQRIFKPAKIKGAYLLCPLLLVTLLVMPYVGGVEGSWLNGLYDTICIVAIFPAIVYLSASATTENNALRKGCNLLGEISYPLYVVQYPSMYLFYAWVWNNGYAFSDVWYVAVALFVGNIALALALSRLYDMPIRKWLTSKFLKCK